MRKSLLTMAVLAAIAAPTMAFAEEAKPAYTVAYNVGLYSQYMFRGLTQTSGEPAIQGGVDFTHESGFYLGAWGSNINWLQDSGLYSKGSLELDLYGGYKNTIPNTSIAYDVGLLGYLYPGDRISGKPTANTVEGKLGLTYEWLNATAWYIFTKDSFGGFDTQGSYYLEANANIPILDTGITGILHIGRQEFVGGGGANDPYSYTDYKIGASKSWENGVTLGGYYTDTNADKNLYTYNGDNWGKNRLTVFVSKAF